MHNKIPSDCKCYEETSIKLRLCRAIEGVILDCGWRRLLEKEHLGIDQNRGIIPATLRRKSILGRKTATTKAWGFLLEDFGADILLWLQITKLPKSTGNLIFPTVNTCIYTELYKNVYIYNSATVWGTTTQDIILVRILQRNRTIRMCIYPERDLLQGIGSCNYEGWQIQICCMGWQAWDPGELMT